jgi:hypothetical protein
MAKAASSISAGLTPWDRGTLQAHRISDGSIRGVYRRLDRARRKRRGLVAALLPWRRKFLDGLIFGLERTVSRYERESTPSSLTATVIAGGATPDAYFTTWGPRDRLVVDADNPPVVELFATPETSAVAIGHAHPVKQADSRFAAMTFRLAVGGEELPGHYICDRGRFVRVRDDAIPHRDSAKA